MKKHLSKYGLSLLIILLVISNSSFSLVNAQAPIQGTPAMIIPVYVYPTYWNGSANVLVGSWKTIATTTPDNADDVIIANVDTGPCNYSGSTCSTDPSYTLAIHDAIAEGWKIYGYVDTGYLGATIPGNSSTPRETRSGSTLESAWISQIETDETEWHNEWGSDISGLFLDDVTGLSSDVTTYQNLAKFDASFYGNNIIFNPGDAPSSAYTDAGVFNSGNTMQFFESCYSSAGTGCSSTVTWNPGVSPVSYSPSSPTFYSGIPAMFTVYSTPSSDMNSVISTAKAYGARYVYVSDQNFGATSQSPNGTTYCSGSPYCNLPTYFSTENATLVQPAPSTSSSSSGGSTLSGSPSSESSVASSKGTPANEVSPSDKSQITPLGVTQKSTKTATNTATSPLPVSAHPALTGQAITKQYVKHSSTSLVLWFGTILIIVVVAGVYVLARKSIINKRKSSIDQNKPNNDNVIVRHI